MLWRRRELLIALLGAALAGGLVFGACSLVRSPYFEIRHLRVIGEDTKRGVAEIQTAVEQVVRENLILQELDPIREGVQRLGWVKTASVTRVWPDELVVQVTHHRPFARWDDDRFVSEEGVVFTPLEDVVPGAERMTVVSGKTRYASEAVDYLKRFRKGAEGRKCRILKLSVTARQSWKADLLMANGARLEVELGRAEGGASLEERFERVVGYYQHVCRELGRCPASVDARYRNAFAAKWDVGPEPLDRQDDGEH